MLQVHFQSSLGAANRVRGRGSFESVPRLDGSAARGGSRVDGSVIWILRVRKGRFKCVGVGGILSVSGDWAKRVVHRRSFLPSPRYKWTVVFYPTVLSMVVSSAAFIVVGDYAHPTIFKIWNDRRHGFVCHCSIVLTHQPRTNKTRWCQGTYSIGLKTTSVLILKMARCATEYTVSLIRNSSLIRTEYTSKALPWQFSDQIRGSSWGTDSSAIMCRRPYSIIEAANSGGGDGVHFR